MKKRLLVVEDDPHILRGLTDLLTSEGYEVAVCTDGRTFEQALRRTEPHLIVLDVMLPGRNGFDLSRDLRQRDRRTPILMLTAKGEEMDVVNGLNSGADDYLTKPFSLQELLARVRALLRRVPAEPDPGEQMVGIGGCQVDRANYTLKKGNKTVALTPMEMRLLLCLHSRPGAVWTREELLEEVWGVRNLHSTRTLDQTMLQLRKKLEKDPAHPAHLLTVHGVGYRLVEGESWPVKTEPVRSLVFSDVPMG